MTRGQRWDQHWMREAREQSRMSKDPSTKVGVVLVKEDHRVGSGWNGFPHGVSDDKRLLAREEKYELIIHAEMNAVLDAGHDSKDTTLYLYGFRSAPCRNCTKHIIQAGIRKVIACGPPLPDRWKESVEKAEHTLNEAGIGVRYITLDDEDEQC